MDHLACLATSFGLLLAGWWLVLGHPITAFTLAITISHRTKQLKLAGSRCGQSGIRRVSVSSCFGFGVMRKLAKANLGLDITSIRARASWLTVIKLSCIRLNVRFGDCDIHDARGEPKCRIADMSRH